MSQITTHILDTSKGRPAENVHIMLQKFEGNDHWKQIAEGKTNADGRLPGLLPEDVILEKGIYRLVFDTGNYFKAHHVHGFYPFVPIVFEIQNAEHYHVPLLLNPYGYSTYRGS